MKILKFFLVVVLLTFLLLSQSSASGSISWYNVFSGTIANYPVTMHLVKYGEYVKGYYYSNKYKKPIEVFGSMKSDSIILTSYYSYNNIETFNGVLNGINYTGSWVDTKDENKILNFSLQSSASIGYEMVYVEGNERLFKDLETPSAVYLEGAIWPKSDIENSLFIRNSILKLLDIKTGTTDPGLVMLENKKKFMNDYRDENAYLKHEDVIDYGGVYSLELNKIISPVYEDDRLLILAMYIYTFTGGAHGNYGTTYTCLDLENRKIISLNDIITTDGIKDLPKLLEKNYKLSNDVPLQKSLWEAGLLVDTIPVNDNFSITPGFLMFNYVPYEISSFADGEITIFVPFDDLKNYLKPLGIELLKP
ncbi:MAG: DUF4163 domain-containing protein [Ignavibacteria bacterium]|nr:DUF4163 domain-containing protein [Ignavibacteria bacterium]